MTRIPPETGELLEQLRVWVDASNTALQQSQSTSYPLY
jgi:hypothetical protein